MSDQIMGDPAVGTTAPSAQGLKVEALRVIISGRVQGVGYRNFVVDLARELGIAGSVENKLVGSVSIFGQGEERGLDTFLRRLVAPKLPAEVRKIRVRHAKPNPHLRGFREIQGSIIAEWREGADSLATETRRMSQDLRGMTRGNLDRHRTLEPWSHLRRVRT